MSKYIKFENYDWHDDGYDLFAYYNEIEKLPSIDIIRCRECRHNWDGECTETNHLVNGMVAFDVLPDDYCSYGERNTDGSDN